MRLWMRMLGRDLRRLWARLLMVAIATFLGVALFGGSYGSYRNLVDSYDAMFERTSAADLTVEGGQVDAFAAAARDDPSVEAASLRNVIESYARIGDRRLLARVVGVQADEPPDVNRLILLEGSGLDVSQPSGVLVERHLAEHDDLGPGDGLSLRTTYGWEPVEVLGIAASSEYLWPARSRQEAFVSSENFGVVFVGQDALRSLAGTQGRQALVRIRDGVDRDAALQRLTTLASEYDASDVTRLADQPSNAVLRLDIDGFEEMAVLFPVLFLGAAALAAFVVLGRLVHTRRRLIGILRANGVRRRTVLGYHLAIGLVPTVAAALLGAVSGEGLAALISELYTGELGIPFTVVRAHPLVDLIGVVAALAIVALASLAPAADAARIAPSTAMHGRTPRSTGRTGLDRLPRWRALPVSAKLVMRSALRAPGRSLATLAGVAMALVLVLVALGMLDTMRVLLDMQFERVQTNDAEAYLDAARPSDVQSAIAAIDGVDRVEAIVSTPVTIHGPDGSYATELRAFPADTQMHGFLDRNGRTIDLPPEGVLVDEALRGTLGIAEGDSVTLALTSTGTEVRRQVAGFVNEPLGSLVYARLPFETEAGPLPANAMFVRYVDGVDRGVLRRRLEEANGVVAVVDARTLASTVDDLMGLFYVLVGIMLLFGGVLAFALIYATMSVTIAERTGELATLRAAGVRRAQLGRIVVGENLVLVLLGLIPGMLLAWLVADAFMASFSSDMFRFDLHVRLVTWLAAAAAVIIAAFVSELPALRAVQRIDLAEAVRVHGG